LAFFWAFLSISRTCCAQEFRNEFFNFRLSIPAQFESLKTTQPSAPLLLKFRDSDYPTFNIVVMPGRFDATIAADPKKQLEAIIESYKQVGIMNAAGLSSERISRPDFEFFRAKLQYQNQAQDFTSDVSLIPGDQVHYVLTFIDRANDYPKHSVLADSLLASFALIKAPSTEVKLDKGIPKLYPLMMALLLVLTLLALMRRKSMARHHR